MTGMRTLTLLLSPADRLPPGSPARRVLPGSGITIGRGPDNDWVLPDPDRLLSKQHCTIGFGDGAYTVTDTSTNGVYINGSGQPLGRGNVAVLHDGDRLALGDYRIAVTIAEAEEAAPTAVRWEEGELSDPFGLHAGGWGGRPSGGLPNADFGVPDAGFDLPDANFGTPGFDAPGPFDARSRDPLSSPPPGGDWSQQGQVSHRSEENDAFSAPVVPTPIPMDWQGRPASIDPLGASLGGSLPFPAGAPPRPAMPQPLSPQPLSPQPVLPRPEIPPLESARPTISPPGPHTAAGLSSPSGAAAGSMSAALDRFLDGAGLDGMGLGDAEAAALLRDLGESFRAMVVGLREVLKARALLKQEFRAEATVIRATENNPLKFSGSLDEAIAGLVRRRGPGYLPPREAVAEAMRDIKAHQVATVAGMQEALGAVLEAFDPANLAGRLGRGSLLGLVPGARRARLWALYEDLYKEISAEVEDNFRGRFGREFARAYDEQSRRMK